MSDSTAKVAKRAKNDPRGLANLARLAVKSSASAGSGR